MSRLLAGLVTVAVGLVEFAFLNQYGVKFATELGMPVLTLHGLMAAKTWIGESVRLVEENAAEEVG